MMQAARAHVKAAMAESEEACEAIAVVDESGFVKKGDKSVLGAPRIQRQYCGRLGPWRAKDGELSGWCLPQLRQPFLANLSGPASVPVSRLV
jgi:hypothetical protein